MEFLQNPFSLEESETIQNILFKFGDLLNEIETHPGLNNAAKKILQRTLASVYNQFILMQPRQINLSYVKKSIESLQKNIKEYSFMVQDIEINKIEQDALNDQNRLFGGSDARRLELMIQDHHRLKN